MFNSFLVILTDNRHFSVCFRPLPGPVRWKCFKNNVVTSTLFWNRSLGPHAKEEKSTDVQSQPNAKYVDVGAITKSKQVTIASYFNTLQFETIATSQLQTKELH